MPDKSFSAKCGHIKQRLIRDEPLQGDLLELAIDLAGDEQPQHDLYIAKKLRAGESLSDYEKHFMVDVVLLHARLSH